VYARNAITDLPVVATRDSERSRIVDARFMATLHMVMLDRLSGGRVAATLLSVRCSFQVK